jgi:3-hydroxybutyrate dehydrogenase
MNLQIEALSSEPAPSTARLGRLPDKVAVITGAASGIGKVIAITFASEGAKVVIADLDRKAAEETASEIDPLGQRALGVAMDVSNEGQVGAGMARVLETFGRLDILISNAGVQIVAPLVEFEFLRWKKLLAIHLDGAFLTTRAALRQMYRQKSGSIIYMGSVHSKEASPLKAPYVTAKHGLVGLAKLVAKGSPCERDLPWLRPHATRREADPGAGTRARDLGGGGRQDGNAEGDRRWRIHDRAGRGRSGDVSRDFPIECAYRPVGRG